MFKYKGENPESGEKITKDFADEYEASSFGRENAYRYPKFVVTDSDNDDEITDSDEIAQDDEDTAMDNLFPDSEDEN